MASLKTYIDELAPILGTTPAALYERQRAFVRAGVLDQGSKRGPGGGIRATPEAVAHLLIAALVTENLSESVESTKVIAQAESKQGCKLTGNKKFLQAVIAVLSAKSLSSKVVEIYVSRTTSDAHIRYDNGKDIVRSNFLGRKSSAPLKIGATLSGDAVRDITSKITAMAGLSPEESPSPNRRKTMAKKLKMNRT